LRGEGLLGEEGGDIEALPCQNFVYWEKEA